MESSLNVRAWLDADEPNYNAAAGKLGKDALPALELLARGPDVLLASKAVYLASLIGGEKADGILAESARHPDARIRVTVAFSLKNVSEKFNHNLFHVLGTDKDLGVRKAALQSLGVVNPAVLKILKELHEKEPNPVLRKMIQERMKIKSKSQL